MDFTLEIQHCLATFILTMRDGKVTERGVFTPFDVLTMFF